MKCEYESVAKPYLCIMHHQLREEGKKLRISQVLQVEPSESSSLTHPVAMMAVGWMGLLLQLSARTPIWGSSCGCLASWQHNG